MMLDRESMTRGLSTLAERDPVPPAPVGHVLHAARRRGRHIRRVRTTAAAGALAAILGVAAAATPWTVRSNEGSTVVSDQSPKMRLAAAAAATSQTSFRLTISLTIGGATSVAYGAYDPAGPTGLLRTTFDTGYIVEQRIVNGECYIGDAGEGQPMTWRKQRPGFLGFAGTAVETEQGAEISADPVELLTTLRDLGTVQDLGRSGGGTSAVDRYSFSYVESGQYPVTGTVEVDATSGKIKNVVSESTITPRVPEDGNMPPTRYTKNIEYSDWGAPVHVERP